MISFIVPAYNEERMLGATLDALHAAGRAVGEPYEVIVADDASTDGTARIARIARIAREAFDAVGGFDEAFFGAEELVMSRALKRRGRFVVLREAVLTSGRKLRTYSGREELAMMARLALRGPRAVQRREGMELWYGPRREDPHEKA